MGYQQHHFGVPQQGIPVSLRELATEDLRVAAEEDDDELVEVIEIVGESYRQEALAGIAGPKDDEGKHKLVGVVLRCDPGNEHDANAVRVEALGQHVGYVSRETAALLSPAMQRVCGGALEARGLVVGGWKRDGQGDHREEDEAALEGHYGIRVWVTRRDTERLGVRPDALDPALRPRWPEAPKIVDGERRLSPTSEDVDAGRYGSSATVTCEEHYQAAIEATLPAGWDPDRTWPLLVDLALATSNPHTTHGTPCIEVRSGALTVGYLTPKMSERHMKLIQECVQRGERATADARASRGLKGGRALWRIKVELRDTDPRVAVTRDLREGRLVRIGVDAAADIDDDCAAEVRRVRGTPDEDARTARRAGIGLERPATVHLAGRDMTLYEALVYGLSLALSAPDEELRAECNAAVDLLAEHMTPEEVKSAMAEAAEAVYPGMIAEGLARGLGNPLDDLE